MGDGRVVMAGKKEGIMTLMTMKSLSDDNLDDDNNLVTITDEEILPVAIRGIMDDHVSATLTGLCNFFDVITRKSMSVKKLARLQEEIVVILCELEMYFPPAFFDVMVHLLVHIVDDIDGGGCRGVGGGEDHEMEDDAGVMWANEPSGSRGKRAPRGSTYAPSDDEATAPPGCGETSGDDPSGAAGSSGAGTSGSKRPRKAKRQNTVGTAQTQSRGGPAMDCGATAKDVARVRQPSGMYPPRRVNLNETDLRAESKAPLRAQLIARLHSRYKFLGDYASTDQTNNIVNSQALLKFTKHLGSYKYMVRKLIAEGKELQATKNRKLWGKEMRELNIGNNHNLGSRGYEGKEPYWAKEDKAYVNAGIENPWLKYKDPLERRFIRSRYHKKKLTGELVTDPKVVTDIIWFTNDKKVLALEKKLKTLIRINTYSGSTTSKDKHLCGATGPSLTAAGGAVVSARHNAASCTRVSAPPQRPPAPVVSVPTTTATAPEARNTNVSDFQWDIPTSSQVVHEDEPASKYGCSKKLFDSQETAEEENP
ncbi:hypothetical protein QYE76_057492 [Lolium multiflorum]|uniref:DUF4218 domain-containing protein n=1 Tax=Lolium multiflorum TaxID=4521 RepID=A0AAD8T5A9_LOLMU|nr:hypothetical protein QYE76_057492 [Lolium multiflorum]